MDATEFPLLNVFALPAKVGEWSPLYTAADNTLAVVSDVVKSFCEVDTANGIIHLRSTRGTKTLHYTTDSTSIRARYAFAIRKQMGKEDVWDPATGNMTPKFSDSHHVSVFLFVDSNNDGNTLNDLAYAISPI